jgi:hypothetical protein
MEPDLLVQFILHAPAMQVLYTVTLDVNRKSPRNRITLQCSTVLPNHSVEEQVPLDRACSKSHVVKFGKFLSACWRHEIQYAELRMHNYTYTFMYNITYLSTLCSKILQKICKF